MGAKMSEGFFYFFSKIDRQIDRLVDRQTDRQRHRQTDRYIYRQIDAAVMSDVLFCSELMRSVSAQLSGEGER